MRAQISVISDTRNLWNLYDIWRYHAIFWVVSQHFGCFMIFEDLFPYFVLFPNIFVSFLGCGHRHLWYLIPEICEMFMVFEDLVRDISVSVCFREPAQRLSWSRAAWSPCPQTNPTTSAATRTPSTSTTSTSSRSSTSARGSSSTTDSSASSSRRSVGWLVRSLWWRMKNIYQCKDWIIK